MQRGLLLWKTASWLFWTGLGVFVLGMMIGSSRAEALPVLTAASGACLVLSPLVALAAAFLLGMADRASPRRDWTAQHRDIRIGARILLVALFLAVAAFLAQHSIPAAMTLAALALLGVLIGCALVGMRVAQLFARIQHQAGFHRGDATLAYFFISTVIIGVVVLGLLILVNEIISSRPIQRLGPFLPVCGTLSIAAAGLASILTLHVLATQTDRCVRFTLRRYNPLFRLTSGDSAGT